MTNDNVPKKNLNKGPEAPRPRKSGSGNQHCNWPDQTIWTGDNLDIMRGMNSNSVDLIYLDPPFNSNANYAAPIGSVAAGAEFKDTWGLDDINLAWHGEIKEDYPGLYALLQATRLVHGDSMMSYLIYMAIRIMEMKRLLKDTGSIYLHCDPTASHYLKLLMDGVFRKKNFRNEIIWKRYAVHSLSKNGFDTVSDFILVYAKNTENVKFNITYGERDDASDKFPHTESETGRRYQHVALEQSSNNSSMGETRIVSGKEVISLIGWRWSQDTFNERLRKNPYLIYWTKNGKPRYKKYLDEYEGSPLGNIWTDIGYLSASSGERKGYPTQKPVALLDRIIKASSKEGDVVLDPFAGCATTCVAAEKLNRSWIGIDISALAAKLVRDRIEDELGRLLFKVNHRTDIPKRTDQGKIPKYSCKENRDKLYGAQGGFCNTCGIHFQPKNLTVDHLIARSKQGTDHFSNLQLLCGHCNSTKGDGSQEELLARLIDKGYIKRKRVA